MTRNCLSRLSKGQEIHNLQLHRLYSCCRETPLSLGGCCNLMQPSIVVPNCSIAENSVDEVFSCSTLFTIYPKKGRCPIFRCSGYLRIKLVGSSCKMINHARLENVALCMWSDLVLLKKRICGDVLEKTSYYNYNGQGGHLLGGHMNIYSEI